MRIEKLIKKTKGVKSRFCASFVNAVLWGLEWPYRPLRIDRNGVIFLFSTCKNLPNCIFS